MSKHNKNNVPPFLCRSRSVTATTHWSSEKTTIVPRSRRNTQRVRWLGALSGWWQFVFSSKPENSLAFRVINGPFHSPANKQKRLRMCECFHSHFRAKRYKLAALSRLKTAMSVTNTINSILTYRMRSLNLNSPITNILRYYQSYINLKSLSSPISSVLHSQPSSPPSSLASPVVFFRLPNNLTFTYKEAGLSY